MFHDNDIKLVVNLGYLLGEKKFVFMINKTLFIRCYSFKCDLSLDSLQHNIMHFIIALTNNSLSKETLNEQTNIMEHFYNEYNVKLFLLLEMKGRLALSYMYSLNKHINIRRDCYNNFSVIFQHILKIH